MALLSPNDRFSEQHMEFRKDILKYNGLHIIYTMGRFVHLYQLSNVLGFSGLEVIVLGMRLKDILGKDILQFQPQHSILFQKRGRSVLFMQTCWMLSTLVRAIFPLMKKVAKKVSGDSSDEGDAIQTEVEEAEEEVATSTDAPPVDRILQNMKRRYTWVKKDFDIEAGSFENNFPLPPAEPLSAVEYFDMFVSRSMLKAVVDESNKYYFQKHGATLNLSVKELTSVLGMFFRMGLVNMHRRCNKGFYGSQGGYQLGLGAGVVLQLCSSLPKRDDNLVVADNFFTGPQLVEELSRMGISYIGTVRENRLSCSKLMDEKSKK
ncbi:hypothetical protein HPB51_016409 [Rhipicephalus microplus]|uniref:PiggyBac transposable element-derived protein domain-containing protein n=1 Tax=Rhipicephalus microplus TaxID=6941 RepID=A0A9J6EAM0_RHIMP|nr:hypothetical protein HPB51_016409 [Rhipicephalus microplus]